MLAPILARLPLEGGVGGFAGLGFALVQGPHVLFVAGVGNCSLQLDQQRLEADPQLQCRLAVTAGVEVGSGAQQQRLADVCAFAAAEHRRDPFLGSEVFFAAAPA